MSELKFIKETHSYLLNGAQIPGVTSILQDVGIIDLSGIPYARLEAARDFGISVHSACELYDLDDLNESTLDHSLRPYLNAWIKFKKDTGFTPEEIEKPICSEKYRFAGTPDRVGMLDCLTLIDIKSTASLAAATAIQTAAYMIAYNEENEDKIKNRMAVLLSADGTYRITIYKDKSDTNIFLAALSCFNWKRRNYGNHIK